MTRHTGTVKWWNEAKGHGFITPDEGGPDLFVFWRNISIHTDGWANLYDGARVSYRVEQGQKGPWAVDVVPVTVPRSRFLWGWAFAIAALAALTWRAVG